MTKKIFVTTQFEAMHNWPDAPEDVAFLRHIHRHMFHIRLELEVFKVDRELEFIIVKRALDTYISHMYSHVCIGTTSCEQLAETIIDHFEKLFPGRHIICEVNEDNENGAIVEGDGLEC